MDKKVITPRVTTDFVVVEVENHFDSKLRHGKLVLEMPEEFAEWGEEKSTRATTTGIAIALPDSMHNTASIHPDVEVGDRIYFHFNAINRGQTLIQIDERKLHRISYGQIFCAIKPDGRKVMIGSRVLCSPLSEEGLTTLHGGGIQKSKSGIIINTDKKHSAKKATLRHIGKNYTGRVPLNIKEGDTVLYEPHADFENTIEGETFFVMTQEDIICKLN